MVDLDPRLGSDREDHEMRRLSWTNLGSTKGLDLHAADVVDMFIIIIIISMLSRSIRFI